MYGVLLIAVLIITGGAIAFIGDRLGTKIGKRGCLYSDSGPHTSIVITIFTGICITTLTFGVMAAASENVRTSALLNGTSEPYDAGDADQSESDAGRFAGCTD